MNLKQSNFLRLALGLFLVALVQVPLVTQEIHLLSGHHEQEHHCTDPSLHYHKQPDHGDCWICLFSFSHFDSHLYQPLVLKTLGQETIHFPRNKVAIKGQQIVLQPYRGPPFSS